MSLREVGVVVVKVTSSCFGDSIGCGGSGGSGGGSTGLGRKASEDRTQSPTEVEIVAAQR